jgi:hypothetical protein
VNIAIMPTLVRLRQILATHKQLAEQLAAVEKKYDQQFKVVFDILNTRPDSRTHRLLLGPGQPAKESRTGRATQMQEL